MYNNFAEDEEDLYSGFDNYNLSSEAHNIVNDPGFQQALKTSHGRRPPPTASRGPGGLRQGAGAPFGAERLQTGVPGGPGGRPMTAVKAAGFQSGSVRNKLDLKTSPADSNRDETPENKIKQLERKVIELVEESIAASTRGDYVLALEKAKEAGRKERVMMRQNDQLKIGDPQVHLDVTYSVLLNLANQYTKNEIYAEALNTYQILVRNKLFGHVGRLKLNMGNIYYKQKQFAKAIKFYRMALDQVPTVHKELRVKIMQNIGVTFVKLGSYQEAVTSFEHVMTESPTFKSGLNLVLCYFTLGDRDKMKRAFQKMLQVDLNLDDEDKYLPHNDDKQYTMILEVIRNDSLRKIEKQRKQEAEKCIKLAAKVISPAIGQHFEQGYDWCIEQTKGSAHADVAHDLEIDKALMYLRLKDFSKAVALLKSFEKKDTKVASTAATNLSFLYLLENDFEQARKYVDKAIEADRYNPLALVNKGNCCFASGDLEKARELYRDALQKDAGCVQALFNLGVCNKRLERWEDALDCFYKLHTMLRGSAQVMYHMGDVHEQMGELAQAQEWFMQLLSLLPSDPGVLMRLGDILDEENDKTQALQYYLDSCRYYPSCIETLEWLGGYYVDVQFYEKAVHYFERAAVVQPSQVKWPLMVASCYRKSGNYQQAYDTYKVIHARFVDNVECLQCLVRLATDLGLKEAQEWGTRLKKAQKNKELREQRATSGRAGSGRSGQGGSSASSGDRLSSAGAGKDEPLSALGRDRRTPRAPKHDTAAARRATDILQSDTSGPFQLSSSQNVDASYSDPLGPLHERPKTSSKRRPADGFAIDDEFGDEELGDDLLPE